MADINHEPSMEDILSSIKRIIAEDSEAALSPPRGKRAVAGAPRMQSMSRDAEAEVLELTDPVAADPISGRRPEPELEPPMPTAQVEEDVSPVPETTPVPLVSPTAAEASRSSLAALSALIVKPEVHGGDTLEGLVRAMLKPMLAEWLDARLPDVVERLVAQEIQRITSRG